MQLLHRALLRWQLLELQEVVALTVDVLLVSQCLRAEHIAHDLLRVASQLLTEVDHRDRVRVLLILLAWVWLHALREWREKLLDTRDLLNRVVLGKALLNEGLFVLA